MTTIAANARALGVTRTRLLESSGQAVASAVRDVAEEGAKVAVVAGRDDAGGVAAVAGRSLREFDVSVALLGRPESVTSSPARENWVVLTDAESDVRIVGDSTDARFDEPDVLVDGIGGTTLGGNPVDRGTADPITEPDRSAVEAINDSDAITVSVDVPSGVDPDTGEVPDVAVAADRVVALHRRKRGTESHPDVRVADVGIPSAAERFVGPGEVRPFRDRLRGGKREGDTGRVFVIGGGPYTGAPALSAQAALRAGADLSFVAVPESVDEPVEGYTENLIVQPYEGDHLAPDHVDPLVETATSHDDVVVVGPGLGDADETLDAVRDLLAGFDGRAVVDADAIPVVPDVETDATLVITPNESELVELGGPEVEDLRDDAEAVEAFAAELGHALVVKGRDSVVTDGAETRIARGETAGMTVGGTGDVLSGLVAAFLGVADPLEAAAGAAYAKERAGRDLAGESGAGFVATDLVEAVPTAIWPSGGPDGRESSPE